MIGLHTNKRQYELQEAKKQMSPPEDVSMHFWKVKCEGKGIGRVSHVEAVGLNAAIESRELYMMIQGRPTDAHLDQTDGKVKGDEMMEFHSLHTHRNWRILCTGRHAKILAINSMGISSTLQQSNVPLTLSIETTQLLPHKIFNRPC